MRHTHKHAHAHKQTHARADTHTHNCILTHTGLNDISVSWKAPSWSCIDSKHLEGLYTYPIMTNHCSQCLAVTPEGTVMTAQSKEGKSPSATHNGIIGPIMCSALSYCSSFVLLCCCTTLFQCTICLKCCDWRMLVSCGCFSLLIWMLYCCSEWWVSA